MDQSTKIEGFDNLGFEPKSEFNLTNSRDINFEKNESNFDQITYYWKNINVFSSENKGNKCFGQKNQIEKKQILKNVTGMVHPGELLAIMGASGAGKTTLLNVLTFRNRGKLDISGERAVNGIPMGPKSLTSLSAYCQQDDLFIGTMTVKEHLIFQALLSIQSNVPYKQRMDRVEQVIKELGLSKCSDTLIGYPGRIKGISGGERKRLSFASEVLTDPPLMFCDEPTSGLDSFMAENVISVLKDLALKGKTIVCTIHQPSSQVYAMFDRILFLAEGRTAFLGSPQNATLFFTSQGYICPANFNPSDFFIQTLAIQPGNEETGRETLKQICNEFDNSEENEGINKMIQLDQEKNKSSLYLKMEQEMSAMSPYKATWFGQFRALYWRSWKSIIKDPMILRARFLQNTLVAALLGVIYFGQNLDQEGVQNINGALFLFLTNNSFSNMFSVINVICGEMPIFWREHFNGLYRTDTYFIAKTTAELPFFIIFPVLFTSVCYYMIGFNSAVERFLITCAVTILISNVAASFGYVISCLTEKVDMSLAIAPAMLIPLMIFGGFVLNKDSIPVYFVWLKYLSWFLYGNEILAINQWDGIDNIECIINLNETSICPPNGKVVLDSLNFDKDNFNIDIIALVCLMIGYRLLAYLALLFKTYRNQN